MNNKFLIIVFIALTVGVGLYYFTTVKKTNSMSTNTVSNKIEGMESPTASPPNSMMLVENNAVIVSDQRPGIQVKGSAYVEAPGYLVIHEDNNGMPGAVLGSSSLLTVGENSNINISLSRTMKDGETFNAILHTDTDGNGSFDESKDLYIQSKLGGPINGVFHVSSSASEEVPVKL